MPTDPMPCERCGQPHARCASHRRDGSPCTQRPMHGQRVCRMHGGAKPAARANGQRRRAEAAADAEMRRSLWVTDAEPVTDPVLALQRFTGRLEVMLDRLGDGINRLEDLEAGSGQPRVELVMWRNVARELRQALEAMTRYGIEDRVTAVLEAQGEQVYELVQAIGRALLAELVQALAAQPGALSVLEDHWERLFAQVAYAELGVRHELESGGAA